MIRGALRTSLLSALWSYSGGTSSPPAVPVDVPISWVLVDLFTCPVLCELLITIYSGGPLGVSFPTSLQGLPVFNSRAVSDLTIVTPSSIQLNIFYFTGKRVYLRTPDLKDGLAHSNSVCPPRGVSPRPRRPWPVPPSPLPLDRSLSEAPAVLHSNREVYVKVLLRSVLGMFHPRCHYG